MEWIARKGTVWGLLKENVFSEKPQSLDYLKEVITEHFDVFFHTTNMQTNLQIVIKKVLHVDRQWRL